MTDNTLKTAFYDAREAFRELAEADGKRRLKLIDYENPPDQETLVSELEANGHDEEVARRGVELLWSYEFEQTSD